MWRTRNDRCDILWLFSWLFSVYDCNLLLPRLLFPFTPMLLLPYLAIFPPNKWRKTKTFFFFSSSLLLIIVLNFPLCCCASPSIALHFFCIVNWISIESDGGEDWVWENIVRQTLLQNVQLFWLGKLPAKEFAQKVASIEWEIQRLTNGSWYGWPSAIGGRKIGICTILF